MKPSDVLDFWFSDLARRRWFDPSNDFDVDVRRHLLVHYGAASENSLDHWSGVVKDALALVILLDQVPRNIFRFSPQAYATDEKARSVAKKTIDSGLDEGFDDDERMFLYLPFEHSEDLADQKFALSLFEERVSNPAYAEWARKHLAIIERFGRFPHRNRVLFRQSTPEEEAFLAADGNAFT